MWISDSQMTLKHKGCRFELIYNRHFYGLLWMCVHVYVYVCVCWCFLTSVHYVVCDAGRLFTHAILIILSQIAALYFPLLAAVCVCVCVYSILMPSVNLAVPQNSFSIMFVSSRAVISYSEVCV